MFLRRHFALLIVAASISMACRTERAMPAAGAMFVDDLGDTLRIAAPVTRIASLSPVATEALFAMGVGNRVVARTHWDSYPAEALAVTDVGNGMQPNVEAVLATKPDLVVLYASEGNRASATAFRRAGVATLSMHADRVADLPLLLRALGRVVGDSVGAARVADSVHASLEAVRALPPRAQPPAVFWHVWDAPVITIGAGSYLGELVTIAGARNVFGDLPQPSPQVSMESVAARAPQFVLAGPNSARTMRTDARWRSVPAVRDGRILVVDTTLVGRPGVRMGEAARHLRALLDSALAAHR